jgi:hypothetical protein
VKASARFVSTVNRFGIGRGKVGRAVVPAPSIRVKGTGAASRRSPLTFATTLFASVALLFAIAAPSASAAPTATSGYGYLTNFGSGELSGYYSDPYFNINPIAVDSHGNILVSDQLKESIKESVAVFAPDETAGGIPLPRPTLPGVPLATDIAVDGGTGALYVGQSLGGNSFSPTIERFVSDGSPIPAYTLDPGFEAPTGESFGVDPTTHDLLVARFDTPIRRYSPAGDLVSTISLPGMFPETPTKIAVAPDGSLYVNQPFYADGTTKSSTRHFTSSGVLLGAVAFETSISAMAVNPTTGVLVVAIGNHLSGYSPTGDLLFETVMPTGATGIAIDGNSGRLYAYNGQPYFGGAVYAFVPAPYPGVEAPVVSSISTTGATVSAEVDPGLADPKDPASGPPPGSVVHFEYMPVGGSSWESTADQPLSGPEAREADIVGLEPNLEYLVRAKASNSLTFHVGTPIRFTTAPIPPKTETNDATDVTEGEAVLNGTVNPVGLPTTYHFEYGTSTAYGSRVPAGIEAVAGADRNNRRLGRTITNLAPGTTYHFRLVAQNSAGVNQGADRTFTTAAAGGISHRAYEQVTPVDKGGVPLREQIGFQARADGSAISYTTQGSTASAPLVSRSMSLRGGSDWTGGIDLDPPLNQPEPGIITFDTLGVSADFTHSFVATNRKLTPDAIEDAPGRLNLYVVDLKTGVHTLVATAPSGLAGFLTNLQASNFVAGAADFSWVVFRSPQPLIAGAPQNALYRWSAADGPKVVSVLPQGAMAEIVVPAASVPALRSVSADGSRIYFAAKGGQPEEGVFLWEAGQPPRAISVSHVGGAPATPHPASLIGTSEDGRFAFFFCADGSKLTSDAPGGVGDMYRYDASNDSVEYLGAAAEGAESALGVAKDGQTAYWLAPGNSGAFVWRNGAVKTVTAASMYGVPFAVSPDGRYATYMNGGNTYLYDADTDQHSCVSCLPDGTPAGGYLNSPERYVSNHSERAVTDTGQVFFTSSTRLVAADANGFEDVYEYHDGSNRLISPGNAPFIANLADISEDGSDVFFTTAQKLVGQDNDQTADVYDARIGGGLAKQNPPPPQECLRDDCKATPNAGPELPFGGSEALSGPGNVSSEARKRCAAGSHARKIKGKTRCVKQSKAKKKGKNTKRANTNRRQGR